ncbi:hypothetical protein DF947_20360 [Pedobacter paludis]|uniref:AB hydrolase-1 domain-containing protein n=2 Tax=Pedobacter paludis TaxID=2203212 RepID=A0A317EU53_9SPHI|nr:hypothetical protein DF947_20360 [Pedobacter paludis]
MKFCLLTVFIFLSFCINLQAQMTTNDVILVKEINVKKYIGWAYEITAEIRSSTHNDFGNANFSALQIGKSDWDFIETTRKNLPKSKNNGVWEKRTMSGVIDKNASKIWLYLLTYGNGDFYFDNIKMRVKDRDGNWIDIVVDNGDFEKSTDKNPLKGLRNAESLTNKKGVSTSLFIDQNPEYKQSLHVHSEGAEQDKRIFYGNNLSTGKYLKINGIKLYYEVYGTGEPLLLLHGNGGSINSFSKQIPDFAQKYKVIAVDTRGQGRSKDPISKDLSYDLFAEDIKDLLDSLQLKNVNVLGWSDGGNTGLILASKYPEYVKNLIVMGANLNPSDLAVKKKTLEKTEKDIKKLMAENKESNIPIIRLLEMVLKEPNINPETLSNIKAKTLVLAGENDEILENHTRLIAKRIPNSNLYIFKGETHFVVTENPALFNKTVLDFLQK